MDEFNGISIIPQYNWEAPDRVISTDACLLSCGGYSDGSYFHADFPEWLLKDKRVKINELEAVTLVVAIKIWCTKIRNKSILMYCDNQTTVDIVNSGRASNEFAQACLREICFITARNNALIRVIHVNGVDNRISDSLSRWSSRAHRQRFYHETQGGRDRRSTRFTKIV